MGYMAIVLAVLSIEADGGWQIGLVVAAVIMAAICWVAGMG